MRTATITTTSGHTWATDINGTDHEICRYFLGQAFDISPDPEKERMDYARFVVIDGKAYANGSRYGEWITKYVAYSLSVPETYSTSRVKWYFDAMTIDGNGMDCQDTLRVFDTRDECIAEYVRRCPNRCMPFNLETEVENGTVYGFVDTKSL